MSGKGLAIALLLLFLLGGALGCALLNRAPIAQIVADPLIGGSPLTVTFDASGSSDPDGDELSYAWDFGDGNTGTGKTIKHTFEATDETEIFTVTLTVTDSKGKQGIATQSIEVTPGPAGGTGGTGFPLAYFTTDRIIGLSPLAVSFDATGSSGGRGDVVEYDWDFGDGEKGIGREISHTFTPDQTATFTVTLFVWNSEGDVDTEQVKVVVIVPDAQTGDEEPVAELALIDTVQTYHSTDMPTIPSLFEVTFSPAGSYADAGHTIEYYAWDFGDGDLLVETSNTDVTHVYELRTPNHTYVATLTVYDDQGLEGSKIINVTLTDED